jgi:hypothetical protein
MKRKLYVLGVLIIFGLTTGASMFARQVIDGDDCSLTIFSDGSMMEICDDGTGSVYSQHTPIGGCAGAFVNCTGSISF